MTPKTNDLMHPELFQIKKVMKETYDTFTLELRTGDDSNHLVFQPGQFNMLYVFGVGEVPISISGDPGAPQTLVHTTRAVGSVTKAMRKLKPGDTLGVRGPFGKPWPVKKAIGKDVVVITGGIGLAPLRPAMYELMAQRKKMGALTLLYGARTPEDIIFKKEIKKWRAQFDLDVRVTVDRATKDWHGNVGVVTTLIPKSTFDPPNTAAFICGPEIMIRFTVMELLKHGVAKENIFISMERNMKCAIGFCGHCQFGPHFICKDGPVFSYDQVEHLLEIREI